MKLLLLVFVLGFGLGGWLGMNLGQGNDLFSNPFASKAMVDNAKASGSKLLQQGKETVQEKTPQLLEQGKDALQDGKAVVKEKVQELQQ
ncbi:hypothetical protein [Venatoribacter cucullus]|uniref:hypothetical protein n=1 Tax=Venatoribacter cucullus TaxID=2661630 RepID=UPI0022401C9A|nr:hypothetical protein [Venatoribacter cucullus]UZK02742.1 hypothetical protein GAY96_01930 [Venatoribacter cucullus]